MRIYFDTEFIEDGRTIDLLSIGLVREDGATYYAEPEETDRSRASEWVVENVLPNLTGPTKPRPTIAAEIAEFVGDDPEFWAWYADYDWVALCQLFGTMMDLPDGWPMYCRDFKQVIDANGWDVSQEDSDHNALGDALWLAGVVGADRPSRRYSFWRRRRCPHSHLTGIYGDEINTVGGWRLRCRDCDSLLDGPVSLAKGRTA